MYVYCLPRLMNQKAQNKDETKKQNLDGETQGGET